MKKLKSSHLVFVPLALVMLLFTACAGAPSASFTVDPSSGDAPLTVTFTNTSDEASEYRWDFGDGSTATSYALTETVQHEYTAAGTHTVNLTAVNTESGKSGWVTAPVTVNIGVPATIEILPEEVTLDIGADQEFTAHVYDAGGNEITDASFTWSAPMGALSGTTLTAGTTAGFFAEGVTVTATRGGVSVTASAPVTVNPGVLDSLTIVPAEATAGETVQLEYTALDTYGNAVALSSVEWAVASVYQGTVSNTGLLAAGKKAGSLSGVLSLEATAGDVTLNATGDLTVLPGPLAIIGIAPDPIELGISMTQQMVADGADQYGNRIADLSFTWSTDTSAGTITTAGLFTAGHTPDTYNAAVTATASQDDAITATVDVTIVPDRIMYIYFDEITDPSWYIMNADGSDKEQLTSSDALLQEGACVSPDGRRIIYTTYTDMIMMNTDGTWVSTLLSGRLAYEPVWSPDGSKIAFQSWEHDPSEIYVMDIDGGNLTQITDNDVYDDYPSWSPDGSKIAFTTDRAGSFDIYVMNANGMNQRQLTDDIFTEMLARWSPVADNEIVFMSDKLGFGTWGIFLLNTDTMAAASLHAAANYDSLAPDWSPDGNQVVFFCNMNHADGYDVYIINKDGTGMECLTDKQGYAMYPHYLPRMTGVTVTGASVVIPDTSEEIIELKVQDITAQTRGSVVRIETDLGSGSGFVIDADGIIMTNNHVISDAEEITVYLDDGADYEGTVIARDLIHDIALVKIGKTGLETLEFRGLGCVTLGQDAVVMGYPLGKETLSVTSGLVSSIEYDTGRNIMLIQTDSAVNPGNSGGPLLDSEGRVIGMVSAKLVGVSVEGVGYAISTNTIQTFLPRLLDEETIMAFE